MVAVEVGFAGGNKLGVVAGAVVLGAVFVDVVEGAIPGVEIGSGVWIPFAAGALVCEAVLAPAPPPSPANKPVA